MLWYPVMGTQNTAKFGPKMTKIAAKMKNLVFLWPYNEKKKCTVLGQIWAFFGPIFGPFYGQRSHLVTHGCNAKTQNPQLISFDDNRKAPGILNTN